MSLPRMTAGRCFQRAQDMREFRNTHEVAGIVEADEIAEHREVTFGHWSRN